MTFPTVENSLLAVIDLQQKLVPAMADPESTVARAAVMVRAADRPEHVKRRVMGPRGHLANEDAAELVRRFASPKLKRLQLAHLSRQCNAPHLAANLMRATLAEMNRLDIELEILPQDAPGRPFG